MKIVTPGDTTTVLRLLTDRRQELVERRIATVRMHELLQQLITGGAPAQLTATKSEGAAGLNQAAGQVGKTRNLVALEHLADLDSVGLRLRR